MNRENKKITVGYREIAREPTKGATADASEIKVKIEQAAREKRCRGFISTPRCGDSRFAVI